MAVGQLGIPVKEKEVDVERPSALDTVAVRVGEAPAGTQEGAVHSTSLVVAVFAGVERVPVLAVQEKESALSCGSMAFTPRVTEPPAPTDEADRQASRSFGGNVAVGFEPTQMDRVPVDCPPRPSFAVTVRAQLGQVPPEGRALGVKWAVALVASVHEPAHEALHWYWITSPSLSEAVATAVVVSPTSTAVGVAVTRLTWGQVLRLTSTSVLPGLATVMVKLTVADAPCGSVTVKVSVTGPVVAGAVQVVERLEAEEKLPAEAVQA
jgi:hypothetical protein